MKIGVIGLGSMGYGIATSLLRAGHKVYGADVNADAVERLQIDGGEAVSTATAAPDLDALVVVVLNAAQAEEVLFGNKGLAERLSVGAVVILCVTVAPDFARNVDKRCAAFGLNFLDAPISGGSVKAAQGKLSVMASGTPSAFEKARPALDAMAETVFELGDSAGAGSAMKAVNQMLAGVHIAAMAEAVTFGMTQGIAPETFHESYSTLRWHELDAGESRTTYRLWGLHPPFRCGYLAQGSWHRAGCSTCVKV